MKSHNCEHWSSRFINSLWSETSETWDERHEDWRIVGTNPFKRRLESEISSIDPSQYLYIIEFPSKRLDIAFMSSQKIDKNNYVILEADRGEDCGLVKGYTSREQYMDLLKRHKNIDDDFKLKRIYRIATDKDLSLLSERKQMIQEALDQCREHVSSKNLKMEILDCEYQFDLNKITFFYRSCERIDFRELVKELYKVFKTRIWMCSVDKSRDKLLNDLIKY
jgi:cell fate regulator YaaT (PSP1 superfamily)